MFQVPLHLFFLENFVFNKEIIHISDFRDYIPCLFWDAFSCKLFVNFTGFFIASIYTASLQGIGNLLDFRAFKILCAPKSGSSSPLPPFFNPIGMSRRMRGSICSYFVIKISIREYNFGKSPTPQSQFFFGFCSHENCKKTCSATVNSFKNFSVSVSKVM